MSSLGHHHHYHHTGHPASPAAGMDQQPDVLRLVLRNAAASAALARSPASVCALLSASADTAAAVEAELAGRLEVCARPTTGAAAFSLLEWLVARGTLLHSLAFKPRMAWQLNLTKYYDYEEEPPTPPSLSGDPDDPAWGYGEDNAAAGHILALALEMAEEQLGSLRSFSCNRPDASPQLWLQTLPTGLTQLKMSWLSDTSAWWGLSEHTWLAPLAENLARLTGLRSLHLRLEVCARPTTGAAAFSLLEWLVARGTLLHSLAFKPRMAWQLNLTKYYDYEEEPPTPPSLSGDPDDPAWGYGEDNAAAGHILALALEMAEEQLGSLRSFSCNRPDASPQLWLQTLPTGLTQLKMSWLSDTSAWWGLSEHTWLAPLAENLARLTGLRSLHLTVHDTDDSAGRMDWVVPGVAAAIKPLTALTELVLAGLVWGTENGGYADEVPLMLSGCSGIRRLIFPGMFSRCAHTIEWGGLTSLTELHLSYDIRNWADDEIEDYALPPNLVRLTGAGWDHPQPLEQLTSLSKLQHIDGVFSAKEVAALAAAAPGLSGALLAVDAGSEADVSKAVKQLTDAGVANAVAGVLLQPPGRGSSRSAGPPLRLGPVQLQPLTALSRLTALAVEGCEVGDDFTSALSTLRGLAAVSLPGAAGVPAGYAPLSLACEPPEGL